MDSLEDDLELSQDDDNGATPMAPGFKRTMAEDKLQEKRLKERARRNGMASSIDEMRLLVPELIDAKKNYSQAKVVAISLNHIYELQRENEALRSRLGMKSMLEEFREKQKALSTKSKGMRGTGQRGRKRRRLLDVDGQPVALAVSTPAPSQPPAPPSTLSAPPLAAMATITRESSDDSEMDALVVAESLAASPALSPHHTGDMPEPFASNNFENFGSFEAPRPHAMDWAEHDHDVFNVHDYNNQFSMVL